jgi:hypothetical protein
MTVASKREMARILRIEADSLRHQGFTDLSTHNFECLQAQVLREDKISSLGTGSAPREPGVRLEEGNRMGLA